ncbi:MAG: regulatory iron-sulfur-containing complex subunit RicT [bacterium]
MTIIGVRFRKNDKIHYFDTNDIKNKEIKTKNKKNKKKFNNNTLSDNTNEFSFIIKEPVVVSTEQGLKYGLVEIIKEIDDISDNSVAVNSTMSNGVRLSEKKFLRKATKDDILQYEKNKTIEESATNLFIEKTKFYNIEMKLTSVELEFDLNKIIFYFTAEGRVDFRELVKDLASVLKMRIELKQIGIRDEAKALNGISICGRPFCCSTFLDDFHSVSIKMAKDQNLSLNPSKISGACGRLMCCLKYEQVSYEELNKNLPREGDIVKCPSGKGEVLSVNVLRQIIKVDIIKSETDEHSIELFSPAEIQVIKKRFKNKKDKRHLEELKKELKKLED